MLRHFAWIATAAVLAAVPAAAQDAAGNYPNKPVKVVVTVPAGGGVDTATRIFAERLQQRLGQPFVIENRGGAGGNVAAETVFVSPPDGYTLMASQPAPLTSNIALYKKLNFDPAAFEPVAVMSKFPNVLLVRETSRPRPRRNSWPMPRPIRQAQLRVARDRYHLAPDRRAVHVGHRHQDDACAVSRHRAGTQ